MPDYDIINGLLGVPILPSSRSVRGGNTVRKRRFSSGKRISRTSDPKNINMTKPKRPGTKLQPHDKKVNR